MQPFTFAIASIIFVFVLFYVALFRSWQLRWGATDDEVKRAMPGDDIGQKPHFVATRSVSIKAPPAEVWKWIIQIGSTRAGFYSIDLIDNANVPSSRNILPKYQKIEKDYFIPFTPDQKKGMWVKDYQESDYVLWWDHKGNGTGGWFLQETEAGDTRLITRLRTKYDLTDKKVPLSLLIIPVLWSIVGTSAALNFGIKEDFGLLVAGMLGTASIIRRNFTPKMEKVYGLIFLESIILLTFKNVCPLNLMARKYSNSTKDNFDIYLPSWLAKYTKLIYTTIFGIISIITIYQILK